MLKCKHKIYEELSQLPISSGATLRERCDYATMRLLVSDLLELVDEKDRLIEKLEKSNGSTKDV